MMFLSGSDQFGVDNNIIEIIEEKASGLSEREIVELTIALITSKTYKLVSDANNGLGVVDKSELIKRFVEEGIRV